MVFDEAILRAAPKLISGGGSKWTHEDMATAFEDKKPMFFKGATLEALAKAAGVDAGGLSKTIARYNTAQTDGGDELGRKYMPLPIAKPPFYAIQLQGYMLTTFAGLAVDKDLRVVRHDGRVISGLYAAGELLGTGQLMGNSYCGGMTVTPSLTILPDPTPANPFCCRPVAVTTNGPSVNASPPEKRATPSSVPL